MNNDILDCLRQLVYALDNAFISSWQSTTGWQTELNKAREALANMQGDKQ